MSNVVTLAGQQAAAALEPRKEIIDALEDILAQAKEGRVQHIVVVFSDGLTAPADLYQGSGEPHQVYTLIGGMELCKLTMLMSNFHETTQR
jgi:hypothetical protein